MAWGRGKGHRARGAGQRAQGMGHGVKSLMAFRFYLIKSI